MPNTVFRLIAPDGQPPYPVDRADHGEERPLVFDLLSGEDFQRVQIIHQPEAKDFIHDRSEGLLHETEDGELGEDQSPLEHDQTRSGVHEAVIAPRAHQGSFAESPEDYETVTFFNDLLQENYEDSPSQGEITDHVDSQTGDSSTAYMDIATEASSQHSLPIVNPVSGELDTSIIDTDPSNSPVRVPTMNSDTFSPVLGGLHRLPSTLAQKASKRQRLKRFFSLKKQ